MSEPDVEMRRARRLALALPARCRSLNGFLDEVVVRDISAHGCRIVSFALTVRTGARVIVQPTGLEGLCGTVRWVRGHEAGVEFDCPLYLPVVEHLHRSFASFLPPGVPFHRGPARPLAA